MRKRLAWQPLFGGGFRGLGWFETLALPVQEALDLVETARDWRREEMEAAFRGNR